MRVTPGVRASSSGQQAHIAGLELPRDDVLLRLRVTDEEYAFVLRHAVFGYSWQQDGFGGAHARVSPRHAAATSFLTELYL